MYGCRPDLNAKDQVQLLSADAVVFANVLHTIGGILREFAVFERRWLYYNYIKSGLLINQHTRPNIVSRSAFPFPKLFRYFAYTNNLSKETAGYWK